MRVYFLVRCARMKSSFPGCWRVATMGLSLLLTGCSMVKPNAGSGAGIATQSMAAAGAEPVLLLALPAAALGCSLSVQQQLTVVAPQQPQQAMQALLEVDSHTVKLGLFYMGQRMGTLTWDGLRLHSDLSRWWPQVLKPERVFSDMQLALWPTPAVRGALPADWQILENDSGRSLLYKLQRKIAVSQTGANALEIVYEHPGWRLHIESPGGMLPCAVANQES